MFGKVINGILKPAPKKVDIDGLQIWNPSSDQYTEAGWKPVIFTDQPDPEAGYYYAAGWKETTKKITQTWTKTELPDEVSDSEALAAILEVLE